MERNDVHIEPLRAEHAGELSAMVNAVFDEFVGGGYSAEGVRTFKEYVESDSIARRLQDGNLIYVAVAGSRIVGVIEIRSLDHVSLLFVVKEFHRRQIARRLLDYAIAECRKRSSTFSALTVNASPYSETIYARLGFRATGNLQETNGIQYIPMERVFGESIDRSTGRLTDSACC
tara:strand:+ start:264 stop:788 length:525 start_codon:yes stop_codon:yes gene_type:complete